MTRLVWNVNLWNVTPSRCSFLAIAFSLSRVEYRKLIRRDFKYSKVRLYSVWITSPKHEQQQQQPYLTCSSRLRRVDHRFSEYIWHALFACRWWSSIDELPRHQEKCETNVRSQEPNKLCAVRRLALKHIDKIIF